MRVFLSNISRTNPFQLFAAILFALSLILASGCGNKCKKVSCVEGVCEDGKCNCNEGFTGELCNQTLNANYNNTFSVNENCLAGSDSYDVSIRAKAASNSEIEITGLWEQVNSIVVAKIGTDVHSFTIARQQLGTKEVTGSATVDNNFENMTLEYEVYQVGNAQSFDQCTASLSKK